MKKARKFLGTLLASAAVMSAVSFSSLSANAAPAHPHPLSVNTGIIQVTPPQLCGYLDCRAGQVKSFIRHSCSTCGYWEIVYSVPYVKHSLNH